MNMKKIIYDKYENDYGFTEGGGHDIKNHTPIKLEKIDDKEIDFSRRLRIHTWGIKKNDPIECDIIFDCSLFSAIVKGDIKNFTGLDGNIQESIINHPRFDMIIEMIVTEIETNDYEKIGFVCNYGKHRSVGWAELLKKLYFPESSIEHHNLKNLF